MLPTKVSARQIVLSPDSVIDNYDYDEVEMRSDSSGRTHHNFAKGKDISKYKLEGRYQKVGDSFFNRLLDHVFLQAGGGAERIVPPTSKYKYDALSAIQLGIGKQINKYGTVRLLLHGEYGYQRYFDYSFYKMGLKADYLFSISDYFNGYNPTRFFNVSSILGIGYQYAKATKDQSHSFKPEIHVGAQIKFYTGPQGYLAIEPYVGLGSDQMDVSGERNWRSYDVFYGVNLNYIYYINSNLSKEARIRLLDSRSRDNYLTEDSLLHTWRMPWFIEVSNGLNFNSKKNGDFSTGSSLGSSINFTVGKWFSPVIGAKLGFFSQSKVWMKNEVAATETESAYSQRYNSILYGTRIEAMFNPLGFSRDYDWNSKFGFYLLFGMEYGQLKKYQDSQDKELSCKVHGYTTGLHLWGRLSDDLQVFVEPRYSYDKYRVPYSNVDWYNRCSEHSFGVNFGLTMLVRSMKYRRLGDYDLFLRHIKHIAFGTMGGLNIMQCKGPTYQSDNNLSWNAGAYAEFHFNYIHAVRISGEFISRHVAGPTQYYDVHFDESTQQNEGLVKTGLWNHQYRFGIASLDYDVNLTSLFSGHKQNRVFELEFFVGPSFVRIFNEGGKIDSSVQLDEGHQVYYPNLISKGNKWGLNGGFKLMGNINKNVSITVTPALYAIRNLSLPQFDTFAKAGNFSLIETINLGVQYRFQVFK